MSRRRCGPLREALLLALTALLLTTPGTTFAQGGAGQGVADQGEAGEWSVQVVALRDLREAEGVVTELRRTGFDAYTEFAMFDGLQFVRVRVGCSRSRAGAEALAGVLAGAVTAEAVAVERGPDAAPRPCLERSIGFLKPDVWAALAPGAYQVSVAGRDAVIVHDGQGWRVRQGGPDAATGAGAPAAGYRDGVRAGRPVVLAPPPRGGGVLCPGRLLHDLGTVAIVEDGAAVVACRIDTAPPTSIGGGAP